MFSFRIYGTSLVRANTKKVQSLGNGLYFAVASGTNAGTHQTNFGIIKSSNSILSNNIAFEASAIMVVLGDVDLQLDDYIKTTGAAATRNADVITVTTPADVAKIVEYDENGDATETTVIPETYQIPFGRHSAILMGAASNEFPSTFPVTLT